MFNEDIGILRTRTIVIPMERIRRGPLLRWEHSICSCAARKLSKIWHTRDFVRWAWTFFSRRSFIGTMESTHTHTHVHAPYSFTPPSKSPLFHYIFEIIVKLFNWKIVLMWWEMEIRFKLGCAMQCYAAADDDNDDDRQWLTNQLHSLPIDSLWRAVMWYNAMQCNVLYHLLLHF